VGSPRANLPGGRRVRPLSHDATEDGRRSEGRPAGAQDAPIGFSGRDPSPSARIEVHLLIE